MRAVRYYGQKDIRVEDIDAPVAGKGQVLIDIAWCGICGTDLHEYLEGPIFVPKPGHPHPITGEEPPVTLGHEFSGVVAALGEEGVDPDDREAAVVLAVLVEQRLVLDAAALVAGLHRPEHPAALGDAVQLGEHGLLDEVGQGADGL